MKYDIEKSLAELEGLSLLDFCFDNDIVAFKSGFGIILCYWVYYLWRYLKVQFRRFIKSKRNIIEI